MPQTRDVAVTAHARLGAESDDRELPLLLGVRIAESDEFLGEAGAQSPLVDLGERHVVRDVAIEVHVLGFDLPGFAAHPLADLDRLEGDAVVGGIDVGREPALELAHRRDGVDDLHTEGRRARRGGAAIRVRAFDLRELGLRVEPVLVDQVDHLSEGRPPFGRNQTVGGRERHTLLTDGVHERVREAEEESCARFDIGDVSLCHDRGPLSVEIAPRPDTMSDPRTHSFRSANKHLEL